MAKYLVSFILFSLFQRGVQAAPASASASADDVKILDVFKEFTRILNEQKTPDLGLLFNENAEILTLAGGLIKGRKSIAASFQESALGPYKNARYQYVVQNIRYRGETLAIVDGVWKTTGGPANYPSCGIFLETLTQSAGIWTFDMVSLSVPRHGHTAEVGRNLSWTKFCAAAVD